MATFDIEQQAQLDQIKQLWKQYGNLVTWTLVLGLLAYAGWTWYLHQQIETATKAAALYEELDRSALQGDAKKMATVFEDMKSRYPGTTYTAQAALLLAQFQVSQGKDDSARATLTWMTDNTKNEELVAVGRLRLAGLLLDAKQYAPALAQLDHAMPTEFNALSTDRRGDILAAQGKKAEAVKAYQQAYQAFGKDVEYRRFVEGKLTILGAAPTPDPAAQAASVTPAP
jgi:predicted negative regulator of RcsB-dependent stress response